MAGVKWTREQLAGTKAGKTLFGDQITAKEARNAKTKRSRQATNDFQKWCVDYLNDSREFEVHRQNNIPSTITEIKILSDGTTETKTFHRANTIKKTVLDIGGFRLSDGRHLEIEVKTGKDTLSKDQKERLALLQKAGAISFVASDRETFKLQIEKYMVPKKLAF